MRVRVLADLFKDFLILGESSTFFLLVVNHVIIYGHFVDTPVPFLQFRSDAKRFVDCGRQTGGRTIVISFDAVGDLNIDQSLPSVSITHRGSPFFCELLKAIVDDDQNSMVNLVRQREICTESLFDWTLSM